jgi:hypothetical protein
MLRPTLNLEVEARAAPHIANVGIAAGSAEGDRYQARAQQHEAGRGEREESVGHEVMFTHDAPSIRNAGPN